MTQCEGCGGVVVEAMHQGETMQLDPRTRVYRVFPTSGKTFEAEMVVGVVEDLMVEHVCSGVK